MDFFRTPGAKLEGDERVRFDAIKKAIDDSTNDYMIRPDRQANDTCVEQVKKTTSSNSINVDIVMKDVLLYFRRKFDAKQPKVVYLTLCLLDHLVRNCDHLFLRYVCDDSFLNIIEKLAKKYHVKTGSENREVADFCLDMIQVWGESFIEYQSHYGNVLRLYQRLKRENLPFKLQNDPTKATPFTPHVPSTTTPSSVNSSRPVSSISMSPRGDGVDGDDAMLQAAISASLADVRISQSRSASSSSTPSPATNARSANRPTNSTLSPNTTSASRTSRTSSSASVKSPSSKMLETIASLGSSLEILCDIIEASNSSLDLVSDETPGEIAAQATLLLKLIADYIQEELNRPTGMLEELFRINDGGQGILKVYNSVSKGKTPLSQAKMELNQLKSQLNSSSDTSSNNQAAPAMSVSPSSPPPSTVDILDFSSNSSTMPTPTTFGASSTTTIPSKPNLGMSLFPDSEVKGMFSMQPNAPSTPTPSYGASTVLSGPPPSNTISHGSVDLLDIASSSTPSPSPAIPVLASPSHPSSGAAAGHRKSITLLPPPGSNRPMAPLASPLPPPPPSSTVSASVPVHPSSSSNHRNENVIAPAATAQGMDFDPFGLNQISSSSSSTSFTPTPAASTAMNPSPVVGGPAMISAITPPVAPSMMTSTSTSSPPLQFSYASFLSNPTLTPTPTSTPNPVVQTAPSMITPFDVDFGAVPANTFAPTFPASSGSATHTINGSNPSNVTTNNHTPNNVFDPFGLH